MHEHPSIFAKSWWCCIHGAICAGVLALLSTIGHAPFLFPAIGGTIFTISWAPRSPAASPRNVVLGHTIAACVGWLSVQVFRYDPPGGVLVYSSWTQIGAVSCAMGVASALMILFRSPHGPAGATTLIVASGLMPHLRQLPIILGGAVGVCIVAWCAHRIRGEPYPLWAAHHARETAS